MKFHQCRPAHTIDLPTPALSRHSGTTIRGHEGTTHTAAHSRHCSLCAVLGNGRHNPTLMRRHQRVAGEAGRVRAASGVGASLPPLPRSLRCDLVLCCRVMSYSVLILSTTVAIPQRCRRSLHRHPRRTAAAATAVPAAAVRRLLCCGCDWCLLRLFLKKAVKNWLFGCCGDRGDRARPSCCAAVHLAGPSPPPPPPLLLRLRLRLRCCYCASAASAAAAAADAAAVLLFSLSRTYVPKVLCVRCCGRSMLLCVGSVHITG